MFIISFLRKILNLLTGGPAISGDTAGNNNSSIDSTKSDHGSSIAMTRFEQLEREEREERLRAIEERMKNTRHIYRRCDDDDYFHDSYDDFAHTSDDFDDDY